MVITNDEALDVLKMKFLRKIDYIAKIIDKFIRGTDCLKVHNSQEQSVLSYADYHKGTIKPIMFHSVLQKLKL